MSNNVINLYFYITGSITVFFAFLSWYYAKNIKSLKTKINSLTKEKENLIIENKDLKVFKERRKTKQRKAFLILDVHQTNKPSVKWAVTYYLKEISMSDANPNLVQFEVESHFSNRDNDPNGFKDYKDLFLKKTNGGWIDTKNVQLDLTFSWIHTDSKESIREDKLDELGINE